MSTTLLGPESGLPLDRPFARSEALARIPERRLAALVRDGLVVSPLRGVMYVAGLDDGLELRVACAKLVVPADAVITDRTAGWLHMAPMVLAPGDHLRVPAVDVFRPTGNRIRRDGMRSGERTLERDEVVAIDGLRVTSKLRTTCDLGMQLSRRPAFAAMCAMMKVADFTSADIRRQADTRFKGYRWVTQLRGLAPIVHDGFDSPGECALGLCWHDEGNLPPYLCQYQVAGPDGPCFLDLAVPELRYAAEYDGAEWHGPDQSAHDDRRRDFLRSERGWIIDVVRDRHVTGPAPVAGAMLRAGIERARRRLGRFAWTGQDRHPASTLIARSTPYTVTPGRQPQE
jgi:hypothetical protein